MKKPALPILAASILMLIAACGPSDQNASTEKKADETVESLGVPEVKTERPEVAEENKVEKKYAVSGMVCEFGCAKFIEEEVAKQEGVVDFKVNYEEETAEIVYDKSKTSSEEIIAYVETLNEGKYSIKEIEEEKPASPAIDVNKNDTLNNVTAGNTSDVNISQVKSFKFSFPKVITYFMRRL